MMNDIKVKDIMTEEVVSVSPDEDVVFAFEKLMKNKVSSLPVLNDEGILIGIVTASDLGHNLILDKYELGTQVSQVMVSEVAYISPDASIKEAIEKMNNFYQGSNIINQLIVIDQGEIKGIISDGDIIKILKEVI